MVTLMASEHAKRTYHRRERRKGKASDWRREPKHFPKKVAHGPN